MSEKMKSPANLREYLKNPLKQIGKPQENPPRILNEHETASLKIQIQMDTNGERFFW